MLLALTHRPVLALLSGVVAGLLLIDPATVIGGVVDSIPAPTCVIMPMAAMAFNGIHLL